MNRSSFYYQAKAPQNSKDLKIMNLIDELYTKHPFYGSRQIRNALRSRGYKINRKKVQRLMRIMGLVSVAPKPNTRKTCKANNIYPYLLGGIDIHRNNQVWYTDLTYTNRHSIHICTGPCLCKKSSVMYGRNCFPLFLYLIPHKLY